MTIIDITLIKLIQIRLSSTLLEYILPFVTVIIRRNIWDLSTLIVQMSGGGFEEKNHL